MIIANPIYDVTFKRILENDRAAKFLIGTILDCEVLSLVPTTREHIGEDKETGKLTLFRMDFSAEIVTKEEGTKKVIIEMQKAFVLGDVYRFRKYLAFEYRKSELPIISIYILGFNLSVESPAFVAQPDYIDLLTKEKLDVKDNFVGHLTHKAYFVQTLRIKPKYNTRLEKLLSVFEQANFIGDSSTTKIYEVEVEEPGLLEITNILQHVAGDRETREALDKEEYYMEYIEDTFGESERKITEHIKTIEKHVQTIVEKDNTIAENKIALSEKDNTIAEKDSTIAEKNKRFRDIAYKLKRDGMSTKEIAMLTGLSISEIEGL